MTLPAEGVVGLVAAYYKETDLLSKVRLIEAVSLHSVPEAIEFLVKELQDERREIWRAALDGLFVLGCYVGYMSTVCALESAQYLEKSPGDEEDERHLLISEAVRKIHDVSGTRGISELKGEWEERSRSVFRDFFGLS